MAKLDLDTLWNVEDEFLRVPHWSTTVSPDKRALEAASDQQKPGRNRAAARVPDGDGSEGSMPALVEASSDDSSSDSTPAAADQHDRSEDEASDLGGDEYDEYDEEEEAELQDLAREALDTASAHPEIFEEMKAFKERSNDNHLLKALGALRGKYSLNTFGIKDMHKPVKTVHRPPIFL